MRSLLLLLLAAWVFMGCTQSDAPMFPYAEREVVLPVRHVDVEDPRTNEDPGAVSDPSELAETVIDLDSPAEETVPLPSPWPREAFDVVSENLRRVVSVDLHTVGFVRVEEGHIVAASRGGGLFRSTSGTPWKPLTSTLPALSHFTGDAQTWIACPLDGSEALVSFDRGLGWAHLAAGCSESGAEGVHFSNDHLYIIRGDGTLRITSMSDGISRSALLPLSQPRIVTASGHHIVVLGDDAAAWSDDGGRSFSSGEWAVDEPFEEIRTVTFGDKGLVVAVGRTGLSGVGIVVSRDYGQTWAVPSNVPRGSHNMLGVAIDREGAVVVSPSNPGGELLVSANGALTWDRPAVQWPFSGPVFALDFGFVASSFRGMALGLEPSSMISPAVVESPFLDVVFTHPRIALAAAVGGGLYRSTDGGVDWSSISNFRGTRFVDLAVQQGHTVFALAPHLLWKSEDAGESWAHVEVPTSCSAQWLNFNGLVGLLGCEENGLLMTRDGGLSWSRLEAGAVAVGPLHPLGSQAFVGLGEDGHTLIHFDLDDASWRTVPMPHGVVGVDLRVEDEGMSLLTSDGEVVRFEAVDGPWFWRTGLAIAHGGNWKLHQPLASGAVLLADDSGLYKIGHDGVLNTLGASERPHAIIPKGDGSLIVLGETSTTSFYSH